MKYFQVINMAILCTVEVMEEKNQAFSGRSNCRTTPDLSENCMYFTNNQRTKSQV